MKDKNYYYCDPNKNNLCFGSLRKNNNFYYLNIKFEDILYIYKRYYAFIDDGLEIFTKQNKSYYFVFNNIGNKDNKSENDIIKFNDGEMNFISKDIRDEIFFYLSESINLESFEKEEERIKFEQIKKEKIELLREIRYRYKGKDLKYNNIDSILESYYNNSISKLEFLMRINLLGNRSFKDINQYPIFPWIINNYNNNFNDFTTIKELLNKNLRQLDKPMGVIINQYII